MAKIINDFELNTCHDIRHMKTCDACGGMGDDRHLVKLDGIRVYSSYHDVCAVNAFGNEILKLPTDELNKFSIGATGKELMIAILDEVERR